jgi:nitrous oxide reductase accessory protein NosL
MRKISVICVLFILCISAVSWSGEVKRCLNCGMDLSKYPHTKYMVLTTDGEEFMTCGVQCGLTLQFHLKERFKSAMALDLLTNRAFDAQGGFYVYKSTVITDMAPGFISFAKRSNAEKFAKGFGGQVVSYEEALKIWKKQMR